MALINKQKAIDAIRDFQAQVTCSSSKDWESGMNEGFDHSVAVIELMETVDAIPVSYIKDMIAGAYKIGAGYHAKVLESLLKGKDK